MTVDQPSYLLRAAQLAAVWAYAVSQPVFSLLEGNPEFLVVRGSTRFEVTVFAVLVAFGPPLVAVACEWLVSRVSPPAGDALHLIFLVAFLVPAALQIAKLLNPRSTEAALTIVSAICVAGLAAYVRWRPVRLFLACAVVLPIIGLLTFLLGVQLPTDEVAGVQPMIPKRKPPVVVVVFDEFPVSSLMTRSGEIDAIRYPNFARLARGASWYRRATTVHEATTAAVPAIVTGKLPRSGELPSLEYHPANLFTLLGESYRMRVHESFAYLCPKRYCPRREDPILERFGGLLSDVRVGLLHRVLPRSLAEGLPPIDDRWGDFSHERLLVARDSSDIAAVAHMGLASPQRRFSQFLAEFSANEPTGTLHFVHLLLPHSPWRFLPSGRQHVSGKAAYTDGLGSDLVWDNNPWLVQQAFQRHLLQVGYADTILGQLLRRLERTRLYDRALVVVVADHGVSLIPGGNQRLVNRENISDIARVPLFVKFPRQKTGRIESRAVQTIDILPTIADVLGVRTPWPVDGRSLLEAQVKLTNVSVGKKDGTWVRASVREVARGVENTVRRKTAFFGEGRDSLYEIGPDLKLLGLEIGDLRMAKAASARVRFDGDALFADVRKSSSFVPARITGTIDGMEIDPDLTLAVAVNGRIAALTHTFRSYGEQRFAALVSEAIFREGLNRVELLRAERTGDALRFIHLGQTGAAG